MILIGLGSLPWAQSGTQGAIILKSTDSASQAKQHARTLHTNYVSRTMYNTV